MFDPKSSRREFFKLVGMGLGGVAFASGLRGRTAEAATKQKTEDFFFLQLSDTHWGFSGPPNPKADVTLKDTVRAINAAPVQPDFIIFTGDLTHTTDDAALRRARMKEFKAIVSELKVRDVRFIP